MRILLVDDDEALMDRLANHLIHQRYAVDITGDGTSAQGYLDMFSYDLVVLDLNLPDGSGIEFCQAFRSAGYEQPIWMLSATDAAQQKVQALDAGADDYVVKPFSIEELLARVRAHLRRNQPEDPEVYLFADLSLNRKTREVKRGARTIELTAKEFDLLDYLISHPKQVLTRDRILEEVWGYDFMGDSNIIEVYIRYLRKKLGATPDNPIIHTIRSVGYILKETI